MFPIRDHNPSGRTPYVSRALIALNVFVFLIYWLPAQSEQHLQLFFITWGMRPFEIVQGRDLETLFTSMFLHGGWMHLGGNMLYLWIFGDNVEDELGHGRFLAFYLACGVAAALAQIAADPYSGIPMVGASGAIAGVLGAYLLMFPRARVDVLVIFFIVFRIFPIPAWLVLGFWFGLQLFSGFAMPLDEGGVAYWAHAGGFVAGLVLILPLWLKRGGTRFWARTHGVPPHPHPEVRIGNTRIPQVGRGGRSPWR